MIVVKIWIKEHRKRFPVLFSLVRSMEDLKIDVKKALGPEIEEKNGVIYRDGIPQINLDGSPITDKRYIRMAGDHFGIFHHGDRIKEVDHQPTPDELKINTLGSNKEKRHETMRNRASMKDSLKFLLDLAAQPAEARAIYKGITGGEMPEYMKNFLEEEAGDGGLTQGDLVALGQMIGAQQGDTKCAVFVRDTIGEKPVDRSEVTAAVITDGDKALLEKVASRLNIASDPE